jgi:O-antigen/teichoic acid export membrane protein
MIASRFRPVLLLLSGNLVGAVVGGTFFLAAVQRFSLEQMGRYAVAISFQWITFGLIGTGLAIATLRLARDRLASGDRAGAAGVVANAIIITSVATLVLAAIAWAGLARLGAVLQLDPVVGALSVLWAGARALLDILRSGLLAQQDFRRTSLLTSASAATGLAALTLVLSSGELTVPRLLSAHALGLFSSTGAGIWLLAPLSQGGFRRDSVRPLFEYARWPALSEVTRLLPVNLGAPLLILLSGQVQAGLFGLGRYPAYVFDVIAVSLYQYWLAKAMGLSDRASLRSYVARQLRRAGGLGITMVVAAFLTVPLLPFFGDEFALAGPLFVLSTIDFAIVLLIRPIETGFHGLSRPRLELLQRLVALPILFLAALLLAPRWGSIGMAGAHLIASATSLAAGGFLLRRALAHAPAAGILVPVAGAELP